MEAKVWNTSSRKQHKHHHLDMRAAYLACEDSLMSCGDAIDLIRAYGFPTNVMRRASVEGILLKESDVLSLTGIIQLSAWEFNLKTHPFTVGRVGEH